MATHHFRRRLAVAALTGWLAAPGVAQEPDALARAKALQAVANQKAEDHAREVIADADKVAKAYPQVAVTRLNAEIAALGRSFEIGSAKRAELIQLLQAKVAAVKGAPAVAVADPKIDARKAADKAAFEKYLAEAKDIRDGVAEVEKLLAANKPADARAKMAAIYRKYPNNPAALTLAANANFGEAAAEARRLAHEQNVRITKVMTDVAESALPATRDMEFPKGWKEKMEQRRRMELPMIGPEEEAILKALEKEVKLPLDNQPFEESIQTLSNLIDKPVYIDKKSLEDAGLDLRRPVSTPGNVTARTALRAMLQSQGLTFVVRDKILQVVTIEKAREMCVTRAYYLGDLISGGVGPFGGAVTWGPVLDYQQTMANADILIRSIQTSIDPLAWKDKLGTATVTFHYPSMSIIVRAPAEVHADLSKLNRPK